MADDVIVLSSDDEKSPPPKPLPDQGRQGKRPVAEECLHNQTEKRQKGGGARSQAKEASVTHINSVPGVWFVWQECGLCRKWRSQVPRDLGVWLAIRLCARLCKLMCGSYAVGMRVEARARPADVCDTGIDGYTPAKQIDLDAARTARA